MLTTDGHHPESSKIIQSIGRHRPVYQFRIKYGENKRRADVSRVQSKLLELRLKGSTGYQPPCVIGHIAPTVPTRETNLSMQDNLAN